VHRTYILIYIQQDATLNGLFISGNCSTCFGWYFHPSSGAHTTVSTAFGICHTVTTICRYLAARLLSVAQACDNPCICSSRCVIICNIRLFSLTHLFYCLTLRSGYMFRSQGPSSGHNTKMTLIQTIF
jgi:hypothetical protein